MTLIQKENKLYNEICYFLLSDTSSLTGDDAPRWGPPLPTSTCRTCPGQPSDKGECRWCATTKPTLRSRGRWPLASRIMQAGVTLWLLPAGQTQPRMVNISQRRTEANTQTTLSFYWMHGLQPQQRLKSMHLTSVLHQKLGTLVLACVLAVHQLHALPEKEPRKMPWLSFQNSSNQAGWTTSCNIFL